MGGYLVSTIKLGFNPTTYLINTFAHLRADDVISGLIKACAFGFIIALFLIVDMSQPFTGLMKIPSEPLKHVLPQLAS